MSDLKKKVKLQHGTFRLATLITFATCSLAFLAIFAVGSVAYYNFSRSLRTEFYEKVQADGERVAVEIENLAQQTKSRLIELSRDNTLRVSLKLGLSYQLQERLDDYDRYDQGLSFFVLSKSGERIFSAHPNDLASDDLISVLQQAVHDNSFFKSTDGHFYSIYSAPIKSRTEVVGTAFSVLDLSRATATEHIAVSGNARILIRDGENYYQLNSGKAVLFDKVEKKGRLSFVDINEAEAVLYSKSRKTNVSYLAYTDRLESIVHKTLLVTLPFVFLIAVLGVGISLYLSRKLVLPLKKICDTAVRISKGQHVNIDRNCNRIREIMHLESSLATMLEELRRAGELERYLLFFDSVSDVVWINKRDGSFIEVNERVESVLGYSRKEFIELGLQNIASDSIEWSLDPITGDCSGSESYDSFEIPLLKKDGSMIMASIRSRSINYLGDDVYLCVVRDITERRKREDELKRFTDELMLAREEEARHAAVMAETMRQLEEAIHKSEVANKTKGRFLAQMSHEIRTPMNSILGMADMLEDSGLTKEQERYVQIFRDSGTVLLNLLNDILDLSKIESGKLDLENISFHIDGLMQQVAGIMSADIIKKKLGFSCQISPEVPEHLVGDPTRIKQILVNLISNAIKFTERGSIVCRLDYRKLGSDKIWLEIKVKDTGIGIAEKDREAIFGNFTQADTSTTRRFGGTGLGLSITRNLVQLMEGSIDVASVYGEGSEFKAEIVLELSRSGVQTCVSGCFRGRSILVVHTEKFTLDYIALCLDYWGAEYKAVNYNDITDDDINVLTAQKFDAVVIAEDLNGVEGLLFAEKFAAASADVCIVSCPKSQLAYQPLLHEVFGLVSVVRWPLSRLEFYDSLNRIFEKDDILPEVCSTADTALRPARILMADDSENIRMLVELYLKDTPFSIHFVDSGHEAVEKYAAKKYDIVLMDIRMPGMSGYEAAAKIREYENDHGYPRTPMIALTANGREDLKKCLESGFTGYLGKPVQKVSLVKTLAAYL